MLPSTMMSASITKPCFVHPLICSLVKKDAGMLDAFGKGASEDIQLAKSELYSQMTWDKERKASAFQEPPMVTPLPSPPPSPTQAPKPEGGPQSSALGMDTSRTGSAAWFCQEPGCAVRAEAALSANRAKPKAIFPSLGVHACPNKQLTLLLLPPLPVARPLRLELGHMTLLRRLSSLACFLSQVSGECQRWFFLFACRTAPLLQDLDAALCSTVCSGCRLSQYHLWAVTRKQDGPARRLRPVQ